MQVLIADALPPASVARELAGCLPQRAPTFYAWLQRARARLETLEASTTGCLPAEVWALRRAGFEPENHQRVSAGLGPLRASIQTGDEPVWLADLVHLAVGAQHAALADGRELAITDAEDLALFDAASDAASPSVPESGFTLARLAPGRWRVGLPDGLPDGLRSGLNPPSISPAAASRGHLENCWPQDPASRPWRRLVNDIQMVWHDHPVNLARSQRGQPAINGLWLYGGARPWTFAASTPARVCDDLTAHAAAGDWAGWLDALEALDRDVLGDVLGDVLANFSNRSHDGAPSLILTDHTRLVTLTPSHRWLPRWLRQSNWTAWWYRQP